MQSSFKASKLLKLGTALSLTLFFLIFAQSFVSATSSQNDINQRESVIDASQSITDTAELALVPIGNYSYGVEGISEIPTYDPIDKKIYVTNSASNTIEVLDVSSPTNISPIGSIDLSPYGAGPNSTDFYSYGSGSMAGEGLLAVAVEADPKQDPGVVVVFRRDGSLAFTASVGALPDMLTFSPDGSKILVANEGEPNDDYDVDPEGSVSIIENFATGSMNFPAVMVRTADFRAFNGREMALRAKGVRIFSDPNNSVFSKTTVAMDVEPEYISLSPDGATAFVSLQESNAFAVVDVASATVVDIVPMGYKDHYRGQAKVENFEFKNRPVLGTTAGGQDILLGGFSGLWFEGYDTSTGHYKFVTVPDRGPNGDPTDINGKTSRPFALPDYQAQVVRFELNPTSGDIIITSRQVLSRADGTPITGLPNIPDIDEYPVDLFGNVLPYDAYGADMEGIIVTPDGHHWMVDEYRPAIYHFDANGLLVARYVPQGTAALAGGTAQIGDFGQETLPAVYSDRRRNRGFEAMALDTHKGILYAFIQTPIQNPDRAASDASQVIRILGVNPADGQPVAEYVYLLDRPAHRPGGGVDKIGDAIYDANNGKFYVLERDSSVGATAKKYLYEIDLAYATNILTATIPGTKTLEQHTPDEMMALGIHPVYKRKVTNLPSIGYRAGDKPEGLTIITEGPWAGAMAVLNDNDFGLAGDPIAGNGTVTLANTPTPVVLGIVSFPKGNQLDVSNRDDKINIRNWPVLGAYQPDAIASFSANGHTYYVSANEGDARDYDGFSEEVRGDDLTLNPKYFPNAGTLQEDDSLGRLKTSNHFGDLNGDGEVEVFYSYGARSFSIWDAYGDLVWDSGDQFAKFTAAYNPDRFNGQVEDGAFEFDNRSDDKGTEPEGIVVGQAYGRTYAFIGLERRGGIMVYDISNPEMPKFVQFAETWDLYQDISPEGLKFVSAADSPTGRPMLIVAHEVSGSLTVFDVQNSSAASALQDAGLTALAAAIEQAGLTDLINSLNNVTLFAPNNEAFAALGRLSANSSLTDTLLYHVAPGQFSSSDLANTSSLNTLLQGQSLSIMTGTTGTTPSLTVNGANIVSQDLSAPSGVIHVIDQVLQPKDFIFLPITLK